MNHRHHWHICCLLLVGCGGGGNLLEGRDLAWFWDNVSGEDITEVLVGPEVFEDLPVLDRPSGDRETDPLPEDPGRQDAPGDIGADPGRPDDLGEAPSDPGWDPGGDGGTDPGPAWARTELVTDREVRPKLKEMIQQARQRIRLVNQSFSPGWAPDEVSVALVQAAQRGVEVRVLLETDDDGKNQARVDVLSPYGVQAMLDSSSKTLHGKLLTVDDRTALVGSSNLTISALEYNHEANLLLDSPTAAAELTRYADALWEDATRSVRVDATALPGGALMADGQYREQVLPLLNRATRRAWLVMYHFSSDWSGDVGVFADALIAARGRGADVRVLLEVGAFSDVTTANRTTGDRLAAGGIAVRYDSSETITHAKVLLLDDSVAVHSGNWVSSGFRTNHEAGAITFQPATLTEAESWFQSLWDQATP